MAKLEIAGGVVHDMPADLRKKLTSAKEVRAIWEDLTPLARNEWICWVVSPKKPETRADHVERVFSELLSGMRRPCCWVGCMHRTDKPLSRSAQWVRDKQAAPQ
jgi:hypothetical protein